MEKEVLVNFAWVTWPERPKGAKDKVKRPEEPPARSWAPKGPLNFYYIIKDDKKDEKKGNKVDEGGKEYNPASAVICKQEGGFIL